MRLSELLKRTSLKPLVLLERDAPVRNVVADSRQVEEGSLFVAIKGTTVDGHRFISDAISRGAVAIVGSDFLTDLAVPYIRVDDPRKALAQLAAAFYDFPARKLTVIGITGTDGKTTTANLLYSILRAAGIKVGMISTVNAMIGDQVFDTGFHVTTPEAVDIQRYLAMMVADGATHAILEATSHGLAQGRLEACEFDLAILTNITHEHLDFHGSKEAYWAAKARLFTSLSETMSKPFKTPRLAVLNYDDDSFQYMVSKTLVPMVTYGRQPGAEVRPEKVHFSSKGLAFEIVCSLARFTVESSLVGEFNVSNILAAVSAALFGLHLDLHFIQQGISSLKSIPGRMELINLGQDFIAVVDFAHTPNALYHALTTARWLTKGRVIAIVGSAGLRDRAKRRMLGQVSSQLADCTIVTAEDPRTEDLEAILQEIAAGLEVQGGIRNQTYWCIPDRRQAIRFAVNMARAGDIIIVCGKGHETSICFGETEYAWDDRIALRAAIAERLSLPGPEMPFLPF